MVWQFGRRGLMQHYYALGALSLGLAGGAMWLAGSHALRSSLPKAGPDAAREEKDTKDEL